MTSTTPTRGLSAREIAERVREQFERARARQAASVPASLAPPVRDARWWAGVAWLGLSALIVGFVLHLTLVSALQHDRAQALAYGELRTAFAKAEAPVGQTGFDDKPVAAGTPIAYLEIPALDVREVIFEGTTAEVTRSGPGHRRDTVLPGQEGTSVILGRQSTYGAPFRDLSTLGPGAEIIVTTGQGRNTYEVFGIRRDGDPMPAPLTAGAGRLELVTANGLALFPSGGLYLDAALVTEPRETPARIFTTRALPEAETALGADFAGATGVVLMGLLLFAAIGATLWAWRAWGRWQTWIVGAPLVLLLAMLTSDALAGMLPNIL